MKRFIFLPMVFILAFCAAGLASTNDPWELVTGIKESNIREIAAHPHEKGVIYAASLKTLYRSEDDGKTWKAVFSVRSDANAINFIGISKEAVFVCTEDGVFRSPDGKSGWKRIFKGIGEKENSALHIAFSKDNKIYLGTRAGLFTSSDNGEIWQKDTGEAGDLSIRWIAFLEQDIFLAAEKGVYKRRDAGWKRIFITPTEEIDYDTDEIDEAVSATRSVNSMMTEDTKIFLATDDGAFVSEDRGDTWNRASSAGLVSQRVKRLLSFDGAKTAAFRPRIRKAPLRITPSKYPGLKAGDASRGLFKDNLLAATDKGIFIFSAKEKIWQPLYKGMDGIKTNSLSVDRKGTIWVAMNKGLYRASSLTPVPQGYGARLALYPEGRGDVFESLDNEPDIRDVQKAAIEYAEVHPDKIENWRRQAKIKAFLPELSLDYDKTINYDTGADRYYVGPYDWGLSVKWDLGELLWNKDQTSIDVRSKLMVQLRDDILDEITRTYFERRRLQIETHLLPPQGLKQKLERDLRIQELTADLDALTGGYFSSQIK